MHCLFAGCSPFSGEMAGVYQKHDSDADQHASHEAGQEPEKEFSFHRGDHGKPDAPLLIIEGDAGSSGDDPGRPLVSLGAGRTHWSCRAWRTCRSSWSSRTGRSNRPRQAAVLYYHVFRIRPGGDLDDASGGKLWSNPPKPSSWSALDLHCFAGANFDLHVRLARPSNPSYDD